MRKLLLATALAALALAPTALGKELQSVSVCGPQSCKSSDDGAASGGGGAAFLAFGAAFEGDTSRAGAPQTMLDAVPASEYYKLGMRIRGDHPGARRFSIEMWYVKPNLIRFLRNGAYPEPFKHVDPAAAALLQRLARDVAPYPEPKVVGAYVNGKRAAHPARYSQLFNGLETADTTLTGDAKWIDVSVTPARANPWYTADMQFLYLPSEQALFFDKPVKVDYDLAADIARDGGLPLPPKPDGLSWIRPVGIGILALLLGAATYLAWWRSRQAKGVQPTTA